MKKDTEQKKVWETPDLVVYGDINSLTQQQNQYYETTRFLRRFRSFKCI